MIMLYGCRMTIIFELDGGALCIIISSHFMIGI